MFISSQPNLQSCRACCTRQQKVYQVCLHAAGNIRGTHCQPTTLYCGESWSFSESFLFSCYLIIHASLLVCRAPLWLNFADQTRPRAHPTSAVWKKCISGDVTMSPWAQNRLPGKFSPTHLRLHPQQYVKSILQKKNKTSLSLHICSAFGCFMIISSPQWILPDQSSASPLSLTVFWLNGRSGHASQSICITANWNTGYVNIRLINGRGYQKYSCYRKEIYNLFNFSLFLMVKPHVQIPKLHTVDLHSAPH